MRATLSPTATTTTTSIWMNCKIMPICLWISVVMLMTVVTITIIRTIEMRMPITKLMAKRRIRCERHRHRLRLRRYRQMWALHIVDRHRCVVCRQQVTATKIRHWNSGVVDFVHRFGPGLWLEILINTFFQPENKHSFVENLSRTEKIITSYPQHEWFWLHSLLSLFSQFRLSLYFSPSHSFTYTIHLNNNKHNQNPKHAFVRNCGKMVNK